MTESLIAALKREKTGSGFFAPCLLWLEKPANTASFSPSGCRLPKREPIDEKRIFRRAIKNARIVADATKPSKNAGIPAKAAPSIPRVVLLEPKLFCQKAVCFPENAVELLVAAGNGYPQRAAVIQGKHTHEAAAVDMVAVITHGEREGLQCCPGDKILNVLACVETHMELPHFHSPLKLYKSHFIVYNREKSQTDSM